MDFITLIDSGMHSAIKCRRMFCNLKLGRRRSGKKIKTGRVEDLMDLIAILL